MKKRLSKWKGRHLSFGGRIILIQSVLSSLPLYFFSFFRVPRKVLKIIIGIQRSFLWGGYESSKKISWVIWKKVCSPKERGGLGIKDLDLFNLSLLGKWRWRLLVEKEAPWCHIIQSRYGEVGDEVRLRGWSPRNSSQWWRDLCAIDNEYSIAQNWFSKEIRKRVGNGAGTSFWYEAWFGETSMKDEFPRLFSLSEDKSARVADLGYWDGEVWRWDWKWRRGFFAWEEEQSSFSTILC